MADFSKSILVVLGHEGGYVFDPVDAGGETLYGIARNDFPKWPSWDSVDGYKRQTTDFRRAIAQDTKLLAAAQDFYRANFWNPLYSGLNSQAIADKVFDLGVNMNIPPAVQILQQALGYLLSGPVVVDGKFGSHTLDFVNAADEVALLKEMRARAAVRYAEIIIKKPEDEKYVLGWMRRAVA